MEPSVTHLPVIARLRESRLFRVAMLFGARGFNPFVTLVFFSLYIPRFLSVEEYGVFNQTIIYGYVMQAFLEVGLQQVLVRFLSPALNRNDPLEIQAILRASLQLKLYALVIGAVGAIAYIGWVHYAPELVGMGMPRRLLPGDDGSRLALAWFVFLGGLGLSLVTYLDSVLVAHQAYLRLAFWLPTVGLLRVVLLFAFLYAENGRVTAEHVLFAFTMGTYISLLFYFLFVSPTVFLGRVRRSVWKPWMRRLLKFNLWIVAAAFLAIISDWMENLVITEEGDDGLYAAARMPLQGFAIVLATMSSLLLPRMSQLASVTEFRAFFVRVYLILAAAFVLFIPGFILFPPFLSYWHGPTYRASIEVFYILYPSFILRLYFAPLGIALFALDQPRLIAIEAGLRMVCGLGLMLWLYPTYGLIGAAWANLFAQTGGWVFLGICYSRFLWSGRFPFSARPDPLPLNPS